MGKPAARIGDMHTCPAVNPGPVPHVGGPVLSGSYNVITGGSPQGRVTDKCVCVGPPDMIVKGSATVQVNGLPAARLGDSTAHGGVIVVGFPTVLIGDAAGAGGGGVSAGAQQNALAEQPQDAWDAPDKACWVPGTYGKAIVIQGNPEFQKMVKADLDAIAKTPSGKKLLADLDKSGKTVTIKPTTGGNGLQPASAAALKANGKNGKGSDSTVSYNPSRSNLGTEKWQTRPPAIGLAHELVHAQHAAEGSIDTSKVSNDSKPDPGNPKLIVKEMAEEVRTAGIPPYSKEPYSENTIRDEWNPKQVQRPWY